MHINILGIRGIPAAHGGFETFAERLALWLTQRGHSVSVYCQSSGHSGEPIVDNWHGIERIHIRPRHDGALGTIEFDLACAKHVFRRPGIDLVLGYNTAVFNLLGRLYGRRTVINMDGIEWKRAKWGTFARLWLFMNELVGANCFNIAIADHPEIESHVAGRSFFKPVMIPYGSDDILNAPDHFVRSLSLIPDRYFISIARIEPENSVIELVKAFSSINSDTRLVVLGRLDPSISYHAAVLGAAGSNVVFPGAIYDREALASLRFHAKAYLHGHQVGGTNPSLVEALGAGNAVIAHDNRFNRWVAGDSQFYFDDALSATAQMRRVLSKPSEVAIARKAARAHHSQMFRWPIILRAYEELLTSISSSR